MKARLKRRARRHGHGMEQEVRDIARAAARLGVRVVDPWA
jgi:plasmid stability protein